MPGHNLVETNWQQNSTLFMMTRVLKESVYWEQLGQQSSRFKPGPLLEAGMLSCSWWRDGLERGSSLGAEEEIRGAHMTSHQPCQTPGPVSSSASALEPRPAVRELVF